MKIFGLGLSRTGTTSLHAACVLLGLSAIHYPTFAARRWLEGDFSPETTEGFQAVTDLPTPVYFRQFDAIHPGARFILTLREVETWLESMETHYARGRPHSAETALRDRIRMAAYGAIDFDRTRMRDACERHVEQVLAYFKTRPGDLLVLDLPTETDLWGRLCGFLGLSRPEEPFPHVRQFITGPLAVVADSELPQKAQAMRELLAAL
jgi:hypothetical protein